MRQLSQVEFARLCERIKFDKESVLSMLEKGKANIEIAAHYKVSVSTFRNACEVAGIDCRRNASPGKGKINPLLIQDMLTVLARVAKSQAKFDSNVNHDEINQYLK